MRSQSARLLISAASYTLRSLYSSSQAPVGNLLPISPSLAIGPLGRRGARGGMKRPSCLLMHERNWVERILRHQSHSLSLQRHGIFSWHAGIPARR